MDRASKSLQDSRQQDAVAWDRQIEEDAENGKLAALYDTRLMEEEGDQPKVPLDEVLDDPKFSQSKSCHPCQSQRGYPLIFSSGRPFFILRSVSSKIPR